MGNNDTPEKRTGLTFEVTSGAAESAPVSVNDEPKPTPPPAPVKKTGPKKVSKDVLGFDDDPARPRTVYVPRFTGISDNYRMAGKSRLDNSEKDKEPIASSLGRSYVDPTAEIGEDSHIEKLVVTSNPETMENYSDEMIRVYKFESDGERMAPSVPEVSREEKSLAELTEKLTEGRADEPIPDEAPEKIEEPIPEKKAEELPRRIFNINKVPEKRSEDEPIPELDRKGKRALGEFRTTIQRDALKDKFIDTLLAVRIRLIFVILVGLSRVVLDCLSRFGNNFIDDLVLVDNAHTVVDLVFATALLILAAPEVYRALKSVFQARLTPELILPVSYLIILGYSLSVILVNGIGEPFMAFSLLFATSVLMAVVSTYLKVSADFISFKLASRNEVKSVVDERLTRTLQRENMALDGVIDEYNSRTVRVFKTAFVSDFLYRSKEGRENGRNALVIILGALLFGSISGIVSYFISKSAYPALSALESFAMVFLASVPAFSVLTHKLPFCHAVKEAGLDKSTFIGEEAIFEASGADVITYSDTDIFGKEDVTLKKVHLYGKMFNTVKAMKEMYSIFSAVGGPLFEVFSDALDRKCPSATGVKVESDGMSGVFEGHTVMAGTLGYMLRHGVRIPEDDYKTKTFATDSTKVMYGAEDGEVYVKFFVRYSFSEEFTMLLPELKKKKITPLIYTRDPNVDCELLRMLTLGDDIIRVVKLEDSEDESKVYRRLSSGIVSLGERADVVNTVILSKRYTALQSVLAKTELVSALIGALFSTVFSIVLAGRLSELPVTVIALWQAIWGVTLYVSSRTSFRIKRSIKDKDNANS